MILEKRNSQWFHSVHQGNVPRHFSRMRSKMSKPSFVATQKVPSFSSNVDLS